MKEKKKLFMILLYKVDIQKELSFLHKMGKFYNICTRNVQIIGFFIDDIMNGKKTLFCDIFRI